MAARRPRGDDEFEGSGADNDHDHPQHRRGPARRIRPALTFSDLVSRVLQQETIHRLVFHLEPLIRDVVREELRNFFAQYDPLTLHRSLPLRIQEVEASPQLKLIFAKRLKQPIYTNNKLVDDANNAIEIQLVDTRTNYLITPTNTHLGSSVIRLEVVVLDGDFRCEDVEVWTVDQFNAAIVKAREGRRPLLVGSGLNVTMSNHDVAVIDQVSFTDNSSWVRGRKFRIGVRVISTTSYSGVRIQEAVSESFTVRDHRGELYQKHYPPSLTDNVWRLENIGKGGPVDKRLESEGIKNVQDFLKLNTRDPNKLRELVGMSDKQWNATLAHAKTCDMGGKCYVLRTERCDVTFNPIGEVLAVRFGDQTYSLQQVYRQQLSQEVKDWIAQAYEQWGQLEEVANEMPPDANKILTPTSNSGWKRGDSPESMISSGSHNAKYLEYSGTATSSAAAAAAAMPASSSSGTSGSAGAAPGDDQAMLWSPIIAPGDNFGWQNTAWEQVD